METQRISAGNEFLLKSVAVTIDIVQAVLLLFGIGAFANTLISIFTVMLFAFWFFMTHWSILVDYFSNPRNILWLLLGGVIEAIPILNIAPVWSRIVWSIVAQTKEKDTLMLAQAEEQPA